LHYCAHSFAKSIPRRSSTASTITETTQARFNADFGPSALRVHHMKEHMKSDAHHYPHLAIMLLCSFVAMYLLMYAMVNRFEDVFMSWNQVYMAALMTAPMALIEIVVMRGMYRDRKLNIMVAVAGIVLFLGAWVSIRQQALITDTQFLRSMIPHHSGAILMCQQASITDNELKRLCETIVSGQQQEIDRMKAALSRLAAN
jgi:uncharacterized protein (DUF305 family)